MPVLISSEFWSVFVLFFIFMPLVLAWAFALFDLIGRRDLHGWQIAIWVVVILFLPLIGVIAYFWMRPSEDELAVARARAYE